MPDNVVTIDFRRHFPVGSGDRVLDLGSGNGRHTIEACHWSCRVVSVDVDIDYLRRTRFLLQAPDGISPYERFIPRQKEGFLGWADFLLADAQHLPFRDGAFDKVMCTEVLEHIPDDQAGIQELHRVARPGANLAVSVPNYGPERVFWTLSWEYWHTPGGHVRVYRPGEMAGYLREHGFDLHTVRHRQAFQSVYWFFRCLFGKNRENHIVTRNLARLMNWYHQARPPLAERGEALANLLIGKDLVLYARKPARAATEHGPPSQQPAETAPMRQ